MNYLLFNIFNKKSNIIIGAIHLPPLLGYTNYPGMKELEKNLIQDLNALIAGGVDGIIFENNYDVPHKEKISPQNLNIMIKAGKFIKEKFNGPIGVSVLRNDFESDL